MNKYPQSIFGTYPETFFYETSWPDRHVGQQEPDIRRTIRFLALINAGIAHEQKKNRAKQKVKDWGSATSQEKYRTACRLGMLTVTALCSATKQLDYVPELRIRIHEYLHHFEAPQ